MHSTAETICTLFMALQCDVQGQMLLCFTFHLCKKYKHDSLRSARQRSQTLQIIHLPIRWSLLSRPLGVGMQNMWWCDYTSLAVYWFHFHLLHFTHAKLPLKTHATKQRNHLGAHLMWNKKTLFNLVVTSGRLGDGFGKTSDLHNEHNKLLQICGLIREGCSRSDNVWVLLKDSTKTHLSGESSLLRNNTSAYISSGPAWYNLVA